MESFYIKFDSFLHVKNSFFGLAWFLINTFSCANGKATIADIQGQRMLYLG